VDWNRVSNSLTAPQECVDWNEQEVGLLKQFRGRTPQVRGLKHRDEKNFLSCTLQECVDWNYYMLVKLRGYNLYTL